MSIAFNDPGAWGYCKYCAFMVARDLDTEMLLVHERVESISYGNKSKRCYGSLTEPTEQPGPEAEPVKHEEVIADAIAEEDGGDD